MQSHHRHVLSYAFVIRAKTQHCIVACKFKVIPTRLDLAPKRFHFSHSLIHSQTGLCLRYSVSMPQASSTLQARNRSCILFALSHQLQHSSITLLHTISQLSASGVEPDLPTSGHNLGGESRPTTYRVILSPHGWTTCFNVTSTTEPILCHYQ